MRSLTAHEWAHPRRPHRQDRTLEQTTRVEFTNQANTSAEPTSKSQTQSVIPREHHIRYPHRVPTGLKRYQTEGDDHLITFSCYRRLPYLSHDHAKAVFEATLEHTRERHNFLIHGPRRDA